LKLYQGAFLPETDGTWAMIEREQLNRQFIETSLNLAKNSFETGEFNFALKVCNNVISHNPYLEEAYRVAMQVHAAQGNRAAIVKQYNQLKDSLMTQLGVMPSRQTETLYRELTQ
jgi:two-component SAPR family response regulator